MGKLIDLDSYRADMMHEFMTMEGGSGVIWMHDVMPRQAAFREALDDWNFDNMWIDGESSKPWVLVGPWICDSPFADEAELRDLCWWVSSEVYTDRLKPEYAAIVARHGGQYGRVPLIWVDVLMSWYV
jgi:hypothetical protein